MKLDFQMTCGACPEQYDIYCNDELVAYARLRWGNFRVEVPDSNGETVYLKSFPNGAKGCFSSAEERNKHLIHAENNIRAFYSRKTPEERATLIASANNERQEKERHQGLQLRALFGE